MTPEQEQQVLSTLYDRIFDAITYAPAGQGTGQAKPRMLMVKNMVLNPKELTNALSPINPKGKQDAAEAFSVVVDNLPDGNQASLYVETGRTLSATYSTVVNGANSSLTTDPKQQDIWNKAFAYLNTSTTMTDYTGAQITINGPSAIYKNYQDNRTAYMKAIGGFRTAYLGYDLSTTDGQQKWNAVAPALQAVVDQSWNNWTSQGKAMVEQALNAMSSTINNAVTAVIAHDQTLVAPTARLPLLDQSGGTFLLSYALPGDWCDSSSDAAELTLSSSYLNTTATTDATSYSSGANASWGLWSAGGSYSHDDEHDHQHMDSNDFTLSAELIRVEVLRTWFDPLLLSMNEWFIDGFSKGAITTTMPIFPTAFVVARNVTITANFSQSDKDHIASMNKASASGGWGPFSVSGSYSHSSTSDTFTSSFDGGSLKLPGLQVIAFLCAETPNPCPPMDVPAHLAETRSRHRSHHEHQHPN